MISQASYPEIALQLLEKELGRTAI